MVIVTVVTAKMVMEELVVVDMVTLEVTVEMVAGKLVATVVEVVGHRMICQNYGHDTGGS